MPKRVSRSATIVTQSKEAPKRARMEATHKKHRSGQPIHVLPEHAVAHDGKKMFITEVMTPAPSTTALNQTNQFSFIIENDAAGLIKDAVLRFNITMLNAPTGGTNARAMPVPLWFDRIEWYDRHSGQEIGRYHGDTMWWMLQTLPKAYQEVLQGPVNYDARSGKFSSYEQAEDEVHNYYLPLPHLWLEGFDLDLSLLRGDLEIKFYPKGNILVDAANIATVPSLNEIRWVGGSEMFSQLSRLQFRRSRALATHQHNFVSIQQYTATGVAITAGSEVTFDLDQFHHESAMLFFCVRDIPAAGTAVSNSNAMNYVSLGPRATIDHENVHGRSLLGDGTPLDGEYMRKFVATGVFPHDFVNNNAVYVIPFSNNLAGVWNGEVDGWHAFRGDRERIRVVTDAVGVNAEIEITMTVVPTAGTFTIHYKGDSTAALAFGATAATMDAAVNALPSVIAEDLKYTFETTAAAAPGAVLTAAITDRSDNPKPLNGTGLLYMESQDPLVLVDWGASTEESVTGQYGFGITGNAPGTGTYQVDVYSVYYRHLQQHNGRLEVEDL